MELLQQTEIFMDIIVMEVIQVHTRVQLDIMILKQQSWLIKEMLPQSPIMLKMEKHGFQC